MSYPWRDEETLRDLYHGRGLSTHDVADELGCDQSTVVDWMDRLGIERRERNAAANRARRQKPAPFHTDMHGYESWKTHTGDVTRKVRVHRLLAVAKYGLAAVEDKAVHHRNNIPWDNRPSNIELMDHGEHSSMHLVGNDNASGEVA